MKKTIAPERQKPTKAPPPARYEQTPSPVADKLHDRIDNMRRECESLPFIMNQKTRDVFQTLMKMDAHIEESKQTEKEAEKIIAKLEDMLSLEWRLHTFTRKVLDVYVPRTFNELGAASAKQTEALVQGLNQIELTEDSIKMAESCWDSWYVPAMESAHRLYHEELMQTLKGCRTESSPSISAESLSEWNARFRNPGVDYKDKEKFIRTKLPEYVKNWRMVARARQTQLKKPEFAMLNTKDIPKLAAFTDDEAFLNLHYKERVSLVGEVAAKLNARKYGMERLHARAAYMLDSAIKTGAMSSVKKGTWLGRIFDSASTYQEIEQFLTSGGELSRFIDNWSTIRTKYDLLEQRRTKEGSPLYFNFVPKETFLGWHYEKRASYVELAERAFDLDQENPFILDIRREIAAKDWESAREMIAAAKKKPMKDSDRRQLQSMEMFALQHGKDEEEETNEKEGIYPSAVTEALKDMRLALALMPAQARSLHIKAIRAGNAACAALAATEYNLIWCRQNGHLNDDKEARLEQTSEEETERHIRFGHTQDFENNTINSGYGEPAVRPYKEGEWAPQIIHVGDDGHESLLEVLKGASNNRAFKYWTTLRYKGMSYEKQKQIVEYCNPILRQGMRTLASHGFQFSLIGPPISLN